jgi:superoxide reductase
MTKRLQIYRCEVCGNMVEVLHAGQRETICCDQAMGLVEAKTEEQGREKHVPVIEKTDKGIKVKVGSVPHPMEETHYIEWVAVQTDGGICRKFLNPKEKPEAEFEIRESILGAREYCNIHGLWASK